MNDFLASRDADEHATSERLRREHAPGVEVGGLYVVASYVEPFEDHPTF